MNDVDTFSKLTPEAFFKTPVLPLQRKYEALRAYYLDNLSADAIARRFGYTVMSVYSLIRDFK
jgi:predicted DNA-binding protein YlxM (UPF0122 family)